MPFPRLAATLVVLAAAAAVPAAHAADVQVAGNRCGYSAVTHPTVPDRQVALVDGGPVAATVDGLPASSVALFCTLVAEGGGHGSPELASLEAWGPGVAVVTPTPVTYEPPDELGIAILCSRVEVHTAAGTTTRYWDDLADAWVADPSGPCYDWGMDDDPPVSTVYDLLVNHVDPAACAVLAEAFPPEGDVPGLWDCPPYDW